MKFKVIFAVAFIVVAIGRAEGEETPSAFIGQSEIVQELVARSRLDNAEIRRLLSDCDASQQSMYFCSWRDLLVRESALAEVLNKKNKDVPECKSYFENEISHWQKSRDSGCERSASKQWGDGSMKSTAQLICAASSTDRMIKKLERVKGCK